jgi:hypothetical protein
MHSEDEIECRQTDLGFGERPEGPLNRVIAPLTTHRLTAGGFRHTRPATLAVFRLDSIASRSSWPSMRIGPLPSHQNSMPSQQGLRLAKEASPAGSRQKPAQTSEYHSICRKQCRTGHLSSQDSNLVAEHDDLDGQVLLPTPGEPDQLEQTDEGDVEEGECHAPSSSTESCRRKSRSTGRMTFSAPTCERGCCGCLSAAPGPGVGGIDGNLRLQRMTAKARSAISANEWSARGSG